jgi:hypothetical protein
MPWKGLVEGFLLDFVGSISEFTHAISGLSSVLESTLSMRFFYAPTYASVTFSKSAITQDLRSTLMRLCS